VNRELDHAWQRIDAELRRAVTDSTYAIWLEPLRPVELSEDALVIVAPDHLRSWITDRYGPLVAQAAQLVLDAPVRVDFIGPDVVPKRPRTPRGEDPAHADPAQADLSFNPKLTFDQFIIGDGNRLAHAAALAVAEMPGQAYNPLYLCGRPGLGKTHLLHAIGNYVTRFGGGLTVRYATVETFTNEFLSAIHGGGSTEDFKARFRHNDVLLIDDVQFLAAKARTEEEFFHTFNALYDAGAQLVFTSDRPPVDLVSVEERLRERFASGLVCELRRPDLATRLTILRKRAVHDGIPADSGALEVVAERIDDNVRALEGALIRMVAFASLTGRHVTAQLAGEVLDGLYGRAKPRVRTVEDVQAAACDAFGITLEELVSTSRSARVTWPRQVAMYLARELTDQSLPAIGRAFGNRDHTTVMHAVRKIEELKISDLSIAEDVELLKRQLQG
jgi:chromosomal replication initiator protein